jgi:ParB family chromosome partitioning protein
LEAAKLAGLKRIPAIIKEKLSEQEALAYVVETNIMAVQTLIISRSLL